MTFVIAVGVILVWALTGPLFKYSDTWQLVINTGTTIITFLMVFLIQNTQNRDSEALHLKIDELIRATQGAKNALIDLEDLSQEELDEFKAKFWQLAQEERDEDPEAVWNLLETVVAQSVSGEEETQTNDAKAAIKGDASKDTPVL